MDKEDLEFLIDLQVRMNEQDETSASCDFQASPYFWSVAENKIEWGIDPDYCSDEVCYYYDGEEYNSIEDCKELFKDLLDEDNYIAELQLKEIENISDWSDVEDYKNGNNINGDIVYGRKVEDIISKYTGCFLTKQACKEHIEKYGYNYSEPHTFAMTADRNPEFERVWNILKKTDWKQISDLEAKLAKSEEKCEELKQAISKCTGELPPNVAFDIANDDIRYQIVCNLTDRNQEHRNTIKQLKQQLEEKKKEIEKWKTKWCGSENNSLRLYEQNQNTNQDKISFCIEKLEKVKDELTKLEQNYNLNLCDVKIYNYIDNQIKQLKEMK